MISIENAYAGKTVAITGASGYLGATLTNLLLGTGAKIARVSRKSLPFYPGTETIQGDTCQLDCWEQIVACADIVFHLAGNTSVYAAKEDPAASVQSTITPIAHLANAAKKLNRKKRVVFASTATVYGFTHILPVTEDMPPAPITNYDLHKLCAEKQLLLASDQGIFEGICLRLSNVYGPSPTMSSAIDRGVLNKVARLALKGETIRVYGDGNYLRDYVYVSDVASAFLAAGATEMAVGQSFNIGSGHGILLRDAFALIAEQAVKITNRKALLEHCAWPRGSDPIEFRNFIADITKFSRITGWQPTVSFETGVQSMLCTFVDKGAL